MTQRLPATMALTQQPFPGSVLRLQSEKNAETVTPLDFGAKGDGIVLDTNAILLALSSGRRVDLMNLTYAVDATIPINGAVFSGNATLKFTGNVTTALDLRPGADLIGKLNVDISTIVCQNGILLNGALQSTHDTAQRCDTIWVKGNTHPNSGFGLLFDATVGGANNEAWIHYAKLRRIILENCGVGLRIQAAASGVLRRYVNANVIDELTVIGCKKFISIDAGTADVSANFVEHCICQYGSVAGSYPSVGIEILGTAGANRIEAFIYDWSHATTQGPIVSFGSTTSMNTVVSSAFSWEVKDLGIRNRYECALTPSVSNYWFSAFGRGFLGKQDNILAHFQPAVGSVISTTSTTGTASCNLATGTFLDVQRENSNYIGVAFAAGTGQANFIIEYKSLTNAINDVSMVGAYFEPGYLPSQVTVQIDNGGGYVSRANFADVQGNEVFCRLDTVGGTDVYNGVIGIKFIISASDTRTVRLRHVYANGSVMKTYPSRGGDRMVGDLRWPAGVGPVLVDTVSGNEYRLQATNGVLTLVLNPVKVMTYF